MLRTFRALAAAALAVALAALDASAPAAAPARAAAPALSPETFRVERYTLPNGLTVLLHEDHSVPAVAFWQWYRVGSRNERQGITGLSHFFEHMMFNGSANCPPKEYDRQLEAQGAYSNAFTSRDMTAYYEEGGSDALETMMRLDADRMASLSLLPDMLESEVEVVREERRLRTDNSIPGLLDEQLYATAFVGSPYAWPVVGWMKDLERITRDEMVEYFRTYYAPNNCILVVAGDFEPARTRAMIEKYFGPIPAQAPPAAPVNPEPEQNGEKRALVHYPSETVSFQMGYKAPSVKSDDLYALQLVAAMLAQGESSRLHRALVYEQQLALGVYGGVQPSLEPTLFEFYAELAPGKSAAEGEAAFDSVLARFADEGPSERELQRAKNLVEAGFVQQLKTNNGVGRTLGYFEHVYGDYRRMFDAIGRYRAVTAADVQRAAREVFDARRRTVVTLVPESRGDGGGQ
jgi:predicted Zn-dependent peptidase